MDRVEENLSQRGESLVARNPYPKTANPPQRKPATVFGEAGQRIDHVIATCYKMMDVYSSRMNLLIGPYIRDPENEEPVPPDTEVGRLSDQLERLDRMVGRLGCELDRMAFLTGDGGNEPA